MARKQVQKKASSLSKSKSLLTPKHSAKQPHTMEELLASTGYALKGIKKGALVEGAISYVSPGEITVDIGGNVSIENDAGITLNAGSTANFTVAGNWSVGASGTFTAGTSTVTFDAGDSGNTIDSGGDSFYSVKFIVTMIFTMSFLIIRLAVGLFKQALPPSQTT